MRRWPLLVAVVLVVSATGCTSKQGPSSSSSSADQASASVEVSVPPTSPPVNNPADAKTLTALAAKAAAAAYAATYDFSTAGTKGQLRIYAAPPRYRVDIVIGPQTAQFYRITAGTVSCGLQVGKPATCALVASPGAKVPDVFDPGVQRLFTEGLDALAKDPAGYAIAALPDASAAPGVPGGKCFHIERLADLKTVSPGAVTAPGKGFETGDYCFDPATGVLTAVQVATGTITLTKAPAKPADADFAPPATPQPLVPAAAGEAASPSA